MVKWPLYMDYNATTPCDPRVVEAMLPYFTNDFGNAASHNHSYGWAAREAVDIAREQVALLIGAEPGEIIFTSGATEAINLALKGVFELYRNKGNHIVTCATEHKAVLDSCKTIERHGGRVTYLPVDASGAVDPSALAKAIIPETVLVALMFANNETGYIHPISELSRIVHERGSLFFSDITQAAGKIRVDMQSDGIDIASLSAHKIYGPKGVGALYLRRKKPRVRVSPQMDGGGHENGFRSGTLNVPGIAGFGKACALCIEEQGKDSRRLQRLRDRLEQAMLALGGVAVNGDPARRLPHVSNLAFEGVNGRELITALSGKIAVSSGSACTSALPEPSHVLLSMGLPEALARASLRFSLGRFTTEEEVDLALNVVRETVTRLRAMS
jgi:cysteine desulfurase